MPKTWLEVALNGPWGRQRQPGIPVAIAEIVAAGVACVQAGAAIVHVHAYDVTSGRQRDDLATYRAIIDGIQCRVDAIVYPTLPLAGSADSPQVRSAFDRFAAVEELAREGGLERAFVDPGSTNFTHLDELDAGRDGFVYLNPESHIRYGLELAAKHRFVPAFACYEPGFVRLGAELHRRWPDVPVPIYRFMFSDRFTFGFAPTVEALDMYVSLLRQYGPAAHWMIAGLAVDLFSLIGPTIERGGHVRVGLEDARFGAEQTNVELVTRAAAEIRRAGSEPATAAEVRRELGLQPRRSA